MESIKKKKMRMKAIIESLSNIYPEADIALNYQTPFQLLVATILSAQCTDIRVNIVTEKLFQKLKNVHDFDLVELEDLQQQIFSTGFYKAKAKNIKETANIIIKTFDGNVPDNMQDLLTLPGVGRKTANVILSHCFETAGIVVDTHVTRLSNRLGFVFTNNAEVIEKELMVLVPKNLWKIFTHYLINHGRNTCVARNPKCEKCVISNLCPKLNV